MSKSREQEAQIAYTNWLTQKGVAYDAISRRMRCITRLFPYLKDANVDARSFRCAVDVVLAQSTADEWPYVLGCVREFYNFWISDIRAIASLTKKNIIELDRYTQQVVTDDLQSIWDKIDQEKYTMIEAWPIKAYGMALKQEGADKALVETRVKLAKLLLLKLRTMPQAGISHFRIAVDALLPLFQGRQTRVIFLNVMREFYYFWIGDPEATSYIQIDKLSLAM